MRIAWVFFAVGLLLAPLSQAGTAADNVSAARRMFVEGMASGNFANLRSLYAPNFVAHSASFNYTLDQDLASSSSWHEAMPNLKVKVQRTVADGDMVAIHWQLAGTNTVAAAGMPGKGDRIGIEGMTFLRFAAGKIAEEWTVLDIATLRKQLGDE
jgi:steroid delta-isomerase-like uncharacterized protein